MTGWPIVDREPVRLPTLPGQDDLRWATLVELTDLRPGEWTLIGGQMVFLHALEHGVEPPRVSTDLDVLVNARVVTGGVREFVLALEAVGFVLAGVSPEGLAHRYQRGEGSTRHCDFSPLGGVNERIDIYIPNQQMTVNLYETFKLPIAGAIADFPIAEHGDGTALTIDYSYEPNRLGRVAKGSTTGRGTYPPAA